MENVDHQIMEAATRGDEVGLKALLLRPGCDPMSRDGDGMTALTWAAMLGHASCVDLLIPVGDALAKNKNGMTALMYTARHGRTSCTELLVPVSDALAKDKNGWTALMHAAKNGHAGSKASDRFLF